MLGVAFIKGLRLLLGIMVPAPANLRNAHIALAKNVSGNVKRMASVSAECFCPKTGESGGKRNYVGKAR